MREVNLEQRGVDKTTDVLSVEMGADGDGTAPLVGWKVVSGVCKMHGMLGIFPDLFSLEY